MSERDWRAEIEAVRARKMSLPEQLRDRDALLDALADQVDRDRSARMRGWNDARMSVADAIEDVTGGRVPDGGRYVNDIKDHIRAWHESEIARLRARLERVEGVMKDTARGLRNATLDGKLDLRGPTAVALSRDLDRIRAAITADEGGEDG